MWSKSFTAIFAGCLMSVSVMLNLNYLLPIATDTKLFLGLLIAFPIWVVTMLYCYAASSALKAWKYCFVPLFLSIAINAVFFTG